MNIKRSKYNDLVLVKNTKISVQNIIMVGSILLLFLGLFRFVTVEAGASWRSDMPAVPYISPFSLFISGGRAFIELSGGFLDSLAPLFFLCGLLVLVPVVGLVISIIGRKLENREFSYRVMMSQYLFIVAGGVANYIMLAGLGGVLKQVSLMSFTRLYIKTTIPYHLYSIINILLVIVGIYAIVNTGLMGVDEGIGSEELFTKENLKKTEAFAKNLGQTVSSAVKDLNKSEAKGEAQATQAAAPVQNTQSNTNVQAAAPVQSTSSAPSVQSTENVQPVQAAAPVQSTPNAGEELLECSNCGTKVKADKNFCSGCGKSLKDEKAAFEQKQNQEN